MKILKNILSFFCHPLVYPGEHHNCIVGAYKLRDKLMQRGVKSEVRLGWCGGGLHAYVAVGCQRADFGLKKGSTVLSFKKLPTSWDAKYFVRI